jgi:Amt family ammonium transporter
MSSSDVDLNALNYTVLVPYNETIATGGDSLAGDLNIYYQVSSAS